MRNYVTADLSKWDHWVKYAAFVHNTTPHRATGYMPFQLLFGRLPNLLGTLQKEPVKEYYAYDSYVKELEATLRSSYAMARTNLETSKLENKNNYDRKVFVPKFEVGTKVLVQGECVRHGRSRKLDEITRIKARNLYYVPGKEKK
jgi:hypothetical protein